MTISSGFFLPNLIIKDGLPIQGSFTAVDAVWVACCWKPVQKKTITLEEAMVLIWKRIDALASSTHSENSTG